MFGPASKSTTAKRKPAQARRLDFVKMLHAAEDEAVDDGVLHPVVDPFATGLVRNDHEVCAHLVAGLADAEDKEVEDRIPQQGVDAHIGRRHDRNRIDLAGAKQPRGGVRTEIAEIARRRLDPLPKLGADHLGIVEHI